MVALALIVTRVCWTIDFGIEAIKAHFLNRSAAEKNEVICGKGDRWSILSALGFETTCKANGKITIYGPGQGVHQYSD